MLDSFTLDQLSSILGWDWSEYKLLSEFVSDHNFLPEDEFNEKYEGIDVEAAMDAYYEMQRENEKECFMSNF